MLSLPGLRVFADARFRMLVAGLLFALAGAGSIAFLAGRAAMPLTEGQFGIDFAAYFAAAERLAHTGTPYASATLGAQEPIGVFGAYLYPPPLAQVVVPMTTLGLGSATVVWLVIQVSCVVAGTLAAARASGAALSAERALWISAATAWFLPILDALWKGNVSAVQLLLVALLFAGTTRAGLATAANALLKLAPIIYAPILIARSRRSALAFAIGILAIFIPSVLLAPQAWRDFVALIGSLIAGSVEYTSNLAPSAVAQSVLGLGDGPAQLVRWTSVGFGLALLGVALLLARRVGGWPAAAMLATAALLLIPGVLWYHYLGILLPVGIVAWPHASLNGRLAIVSGGAGVTVGLAWLPLALAGATIMVGASLRAVWPAQTGSDA